MGDLPLALTVLMYVFFGVGSLILLCILPTALAHLAMELWDSWANLRKARRDRKWRRS